jgi:perosamine synthetase
MGVAQMQSAERQIAKKRTIRDWYIEEFSGVSHVRMQEELQGTRSICWLSSLYFDEPDFNRDYLRSTLLAKGIDTRPVFSPISQYPIWNKKYDPQTNARRIGDNAINLPSGVGLSRASVAKIGKEIREYLS